MVLGFVYLGDDQSIAEGADLQHVQEGCLGHTDPVAGLDDVDILDDLDSSLGNLGGDGQSLRKTFLAHKLIN